MHWRRRSQSLRASGEVLIMDTSETYIKMCDCPEVQSEEVRSRGYQLRPPSEGDFYAYKRYGKYKWQSVIDYSQEHTTIGHPIYLPRQDQIQEMMKAISKFWKNIPPYLYNERLFFWNQRQGIRGDKTSMEQLWLAFYMSEKHHKFWDGDKWVKRK